VPNHGRAAELNYVISNLFEFGEINGSIVVGKVHWGVFQFASTSGGSDPMCSRKVATFQISSSDIIPFQAPIPL
jgi:hypothetical protein